MQGFWRHPALPIGVVLLVLGLGNWLVSRGQAERIPAAQRAPPNRSSTPARWRASRSLTPRTNATLLERLHRRPATTASPMRERDFYIVVHERRPPHRGRSACSLIGAGLLGRWRERRMRRAARRSPPSAPASAARA